jgi:Tfp pilus assembly protein PilZ
LVGFGILGVKRWGYILFLTFNTILIAFAIYYLAKYGIGLDGALVFNLFVTLIPFFLILYFLNQEISTPYLTLLPRGFRGKWRIEVPISGEVLIEGKKALRLATMDISPSGCLAKVEGTVPDNAHLNIRLDIERKWEVPVQLVRREDNELEGYNLGFKFEYEVNDHRKKELKKYLSTKLLPRFSITTPVEVEFNSKKFSGEVINVSEGGFYLSTKEILNPGDEISFQLKLMGFPFKGTGKVSWENQKEEFNKPAGCGITFTKIESNFLYNLILFFFEKKLSLEYRER